MSLEPGVNTYGTLAEADAFHAARPTAAQWLLVGEPAERETWLIAAYDSINAIESSEVWEPPFPSCVIKAQAVFALELYNSSVSSGDVEDLISSSARLKKVGPEDGFEIFDDKTDIEDAAVLSVAVDRFLNSHDCSGHFKVSSPPINNAGSLSTGIIIY